ncbi:tautomerase family protein [Millisia brevis]|uniref:tautomerase family protein n=1 Tax=Millisia brevis TaxID=264148 RepID=UPI0008306BD2|nr:tautomerase family protein [Millisia brevis]
MPVAQFHLPSAAFDPERRRELLVRASAGYARILDSPIERVRVLLVDYPPADIAVGGVVGSEPGPETAAPYFTAVVLAGRPAQQRAELLGHFTDLLVEILGVDRSGVRGRIIEVEPDNWGIAGTPAARVRSEEIARRAVKNAPAQLGR